MFFRDLLQQLLFQFFDNLLIKYYFSKKYNDNRGNLWYYCQVYNYNTLNTEKEK